MENFYYIPIELLLCIGIIIFLARLLYIMLSNKDDFDEPEEQI